MTAAKAQPKLGPGAVVFYAIVTLFGLFAMIAFIKTGQPLWAVPAIACLPAAERLHSNYFRRIR